MALEYTLQQACLVPPGAELRLSGLVIEGRGRWRTCGSLMARPPPRCARSRTDRRLQPAQSMPTSRCASVSRARLSDRQAGRQARTHALGMAGAQCGLRERALGDAMPYPGYRCSQSHTLPVFAASSLAQFRVVKTNKRGKAQNRILELNFQDGVITVRAASPIAPRLPSLTHLRAHRRTLWCSPPRVVSRHCRTKTRGVKSRRPITPRR
eukprot:COSAG02_NODE_12670_length_1511_cov_10.557365_1_plen_210_part_00